MSGQRNSDREADEFARRGRETGQVDETGQVEETRSIMTPQMAFAEAMKFENRANPYPFFDELRKTPVARMDNGLYVVSGYRELLTLLHDPRLSSDMRSSPLAAAAGSAAGSPPDGLEAYGKDPSMIDRKSTRL